MTKHFKASLIISSVLLGLFIFSVIIHNVISVIFNFEEPVFFALATILVSVLPFVFLYTFVVWAKERFKKRNK